MSFLDTWDSKPNMCRTLALKYTCGCIVDFRLSTCHGTRGTRRGVDFLDCRPRRSKMTCSSMPYLVLYAGGRCGDCEVAYRKRDLIDAQKQWAREVEHTRQRWFTMVIEEAGPCEFRAAKLEFEAAEAQVEELARQLSHMGFDLYRQYPTSPPEGKIRSWPREGESGDIPRWECSGGSPLKREVFPEEILEPYDTLEVTLDAGGTETVSEEAWWDVEADTLVENQGVQDQEDSLYRPPSAFSHHRFDHNTERLRDYDAAQAEILDHSDINESSNSDVESPDDRQRCTPLGQQGPEHRWSRLLSPVWERSDESYSEADAIDSSLDASSISSVANQSSPDNASTRSGKLVSPSRGSDPEHRGRLSGSTASRSPSRYTVSPSQRRPVPGDYRNRPRTQAERSSSPLPDFVFAPPAEGLESTLRMPSGIVPPLKLIGKFSFENLGQSRSLSRVLGETSHRGAEDIVWTSNRPTYGTWSSRMNRSMMSATPSLTSLSSKASVQSAELAQQGRAHEVSIGRRLQSDLRKDSMSPVADPTSALDVVGLASPNDHLGIAFWNWKQTGTDEHWLG